MSFEIISEILDSRKSRWQKYKGNASARLEDGTMLNAELINMKYMAESNSKESNLCIN